MERVNAEIVGTVILHHSNELPGRENEPKECICCPDFPSHVYQCELRLPDFMPHRPEWITRDLYQWIRTNFDLKKLEGRRIKITAEVVE